MKEVFNKILAIFMAFVVLFSTMSFAVHEHYCGEDFVDSSLFSKSTSCEMDMVMDMKMEMPMEDCTIEDNENCCIDVVIQIEGQSELKTPVLKLDYEQQFFIASFVYSYINLFEGLDENIVPFKYYSPPLLIKDIQVLDEVFII